jgi:hypothetical protein
MLPIDIEKFAVAAQWKHLPESVVERDFQSTARDERFPGAVLPAVDSQGRVCWYAAVSTGAQWRQLRPMLQAYVGPTVTDFIGEPVHPDLTVAAERVLQESGAFAIARLTPGERCGEFAMHALTRMREALAFRPVSRQRVPETTSSLLARLDMSLAAGARAEAFRFLEQMRSELRLDTLNLHFVEVRILATFRDWAALVDAEWFTQLCFVRKPAVVAGSMLEALWYARLAAVEENPARLAQEYREKVQALARPLLAQAPDHHAVLSRFHELDSPTGFVSEAPGAVAQELLEHAAEAPSAERIAEVRDAIEALQAETRETLLDSAAGQHALSQLGSIEIPLPKDWSEWLQCLSDEAFVNAAIVAREGAVEWRTHELFGAQQAGNLADQLLQVGFAEGRGKDRLIESLPSLVRWVKEDPAYPRPPLRGVYEALLLMFALLERRDSSARAAASDLLDAILEVGSTADEYRRLLKDFESLIDEGAGESSTYWLIDVAAVLLHHPCPDANARLVLLNRILHSLQSFLSVLTPGQRASYNRIASGASWPTLPPPLIETAGAIAEILTGKSIAIYTLTESAGRQAESALQSMVPGLRVDLAHDHVASPRLTRLSRDADVFVLTAASAKHAATDCILANRGNKPLLYTAGRGFSSIVRAIEEFAQNQ